MRRIKTQICRRLVCVGLMTASIGCLTQTGCQVSQNGQVLPSPTYFTDDIQYFPAGPEFKLPKEAAALQAARAQEKLDQR